MNALFSPSWPQHLLGSSPIASREHAPTPAKQLLASLALVCAFALQMVWGSVGWAGEPDAPSQPNIVFVLADDLGWRDLSCYGSDFCETPFIDSLAEVGMRFTTAYSAGSICSPTRASLMTGRHPVRTGVTDYIPGLKSKPAQMRTPRTDTQLALEEVTIGEMLSQVGYRTFYCGKWHLGNRGFEPSEQGFDEYVGEKQLGNPSRDWQVGQRIAASFESYVAKSDSQRPFFAYLAFHEPHIPILTYPEHIDHFRDKSAKLGPSPAPIPERDGLLRIRQDDAAYGSEVAGLDDCVGQILGTLDRHGLRENTIVVFFSDNGGLAIKSQPGPTSNAPLRAGKGWLYEGGIRVPLIVSYPGRIQPGESDQCVVSYDLVPTLLELAGAPLPAGTAIDGRSIAGVLLGEIAELPERAEVWHYPHYHGSTWAPGAAIRQGKWKLLQLDHFAQTELYDLENDISERHNLADQHPEITARLQQQLADWQAAAGAKFAKPKNLDTENLVAWCIVPFDAAKRGPAERARMLSGLGLKHLAYDWREEHVATWDAELDALTQNNIELTAFWCSSSLKPSQDPGAQRILDFLRRRQVQTQLWVMLPDAALATIEDETARVQAAATAIGELASQAQELGCSVGLYNHGGWVGRPDSMVRIMQALKDHPNVGIVYNFHHAHDDLSAFPQALVAMRPYLMCLNLNGTTLGGPKIQSLGAGQLDHQILSWIRMAQYTGPIGILDHRETLDARESLQQNLDGLKTLLGHVE